MTEILTKTKNKLLLPKFLIPILLAILAPATYLVGISFYQGTMDAYGIDSSIFPLATTDVYINSYQTVGYLLLDLATIIAKFLHLMADPLMDLYLVLIMVGVSIFLYFLVKFIKRSKSISRPKNTRLTRILYRIRMKLSALHWENNDLSKSIALVSVTTYLIVVMLLVTVYIAVLWWAIPIIAVSEGREVANKRIAEFQKTGCTVDKKTKWNDCFVLSDGKGNVLHEGLLIAKNDKEIAIFKKDGSYILRLPDEYSLHRQLSPTP